EDIVELLSLTVQVVDRPDRHIDAELVVGRSAPRSAAPALYASLAQDGAAISKQAGPNATGIPHPFLAACAAPMVVGAVLNTAIADDALPGVSLPMTFRFDQLGLATGALRRERDLSGMV